jgi:hypothetical protein
LSGAIESLNRWVEWCLRLEARVFVAESSNEWPYVAQVEAVKLLKLQTQDHLAYWWLAKAWKRALIRHGVRACVAQARGRDSVGECRR